MTKAIPTKLDKGLVEQLDRLVSEGLYASRSESIRDAVRRLVTERYMSLQRFYEIISRITSEVILQHFEGTVTDIILYGSVAKGEATTESDIDLLILTDREEGTREFRRLDGRISLITYPIDLEANVVTTPLLMSRRRFLKLVEEKYTFANEVLKNGLQLYGNILKHVRG